MPVESLRNHNQVRSRAASSVEQQLAHDRGDYTVDESLGEDVGPLADSLARAANAPPGGARGTSKKRNGSGFSHGTGDLTPKAKAKQTKSRAVSKSKDESTSADVRQRPPASAQRLIDRLDIAMREAGVNQSKLAAALGIKSQGFTNMRRKPNAGMHHELIARAAIALRCSLHWLCTGEGGEYVPANKGGPGRMSRMAREVAEWIDALPPDDHLKAWAVMARIKAGYWPTFIDDDPPTRGRGK